jgi:hypothetical protein
LCETCGPTEVGPFPSGDDFIRKSGPKFVDHAAAKPVK